MNKINAILGTMSINNVIFAIIMFGTFFMATVWSIQAPFFPKEAERKGLSPTQYSLVFAIYELTTILVTPLVGMYMSYMGARFLAIAGLFVSAVTVILFGILVYVKSSSDFFILSAVVRIVEAIGMSSYCISLVVLISTLYPTSVAFRQSLNEMCFGGGMIFGPSIGGFLYVWGGYLMPFMSVGLTLLAVVIVSILFLPETEHDYQPSSSPISLTLSCLKIFRVWVNLFSILSCSITIGFISATLEPQLRQLNLSSEIVGLIFTLHPVMYVWIAPLFGYWIDRGLDKRLCIIIGASAKVLAFSLIGPLPWTDLVFSLHLVSIGLVINGFSNGAIINAILQELLTITAEYIPETKEVSHGIASGLFQTTFALGTFIGPLFGGYVLKTVGFQWGAFAIVVLNIIVVLTVAHMVIQQKIKRPAVLETKALLG